MPATMMEFSYVGPDGGGAKIPVPDFPLAVTDAAISGTVVSITLNASTAFVRIYSDTACLARPDADPTSSDGVSVPVTADGKWHEFTVTGPGGNQKYTTIRFKDTT